MKEGSKIVASVISHQESTALKGLYMLLIVLGHNWFFTMATVDLQLMSYMYMFHIAAFFMLPFLYGAKKWSWQSVRDNAARLLWPYLILVTLFFVGVTVIEHRQLEITGFFKTLFLGDSGDLQRYCGFQVLWFLPAMFCVVLIKDLYFNFKLFRIILLLVALYFVVARLIVNLFGVDVSFNWPDWPWSLAYTIPFCLYGLIVRFVTKAQVNRWIVISICAILAVGVSVYYFCDIPTWRNMKAFNIGQILYPAAFMLLVIPISGYLSRLKWLMWVGKNSLLIYLIHPFAGYAMMMLFPTYMDWDTAAKVVMIVASLMAIGLITIGLTYVVTNWCKPVYNFMFPRSMSALKEMFKVRRNRKYE